MSQLSEMSAQALARDPSEIAVGFKGRTYAVADLRRVADRLEAALDATGADPRARVIFIARNQPAALAAMLGLLRAGRSIQMVYPFQSPTALARNIERLDAAVVVAGEGEFTEEVRAVLHAKGLAAVALTDMDAAALPGFERATAEVAELPPQQVEILTSGTTGPPKHFAVPYDTIAVHFVGAANMMMPETGADAPPVLIYFPLGNISGLYGTLPPLVAGARIELLERFDAHAWGAFVKRFKPTIFGLPSAVVQSVLDADIPKEDLASVRYFNGGAAHLDPAVHRAFEARYGVPLLSSYGATEFGGPVSAWTIELYEKFGDSKFGSIGVPFGGAQIRAVDPETHEPLPAGEEGLLQVISPRIGPDWIQTADLGVVDADGFVFHRGRADGALMRGGFKILPETIEKALLLHPAIKEAAVVGRKDHRLGQVPVAALIADPGVERPSFEDLEAHLRGHVLATHIPVAWRWLDAMPRTPSMKVDKRALAEQFDAAQTA